MTDDRNPEEKPSFFDSADMAKSWPPSEGYEVEESAIVDPKFDAPAQEPEQYEPDALDELLAEDKPKPAVPPVEPIPEAGYTDMIMHDFSSFDAKETAEAKEEPKEEEAKSQEEDFLVPKNKPIKEEETLIDMENIPELEPDAAFVEIRKDKPQAQDTDKVKIVADDDDEDTLSEIFVSDRKPKEEIKPPTDDEIFISRAGADLEDATGNKADADFNLDKYVQEKIGVGPGGDVAAGLDYDFVAVPPPVNANTGEDYDLSSGDEIEEDTKPFRTYASLDYSEEPVSQANAEEPAGVMAFVQNNRNLVILGGVIALLLMYFGFTNLFNKKYEVTGRERSRRPAKEKRISTEDKEFVPLWEISSQKYKGDDEERLLVQTIYKSSGRQNPFAMPESILADLQKAAELELIKKQKPDTYRRLAYRATLVGVLTSKDNTIALVNQQEASFDVLEGTSRDKILKLATKSMDKAKKDTQEMVVGGYIGPWVITKITSPQSAFSEAKVYIEYHGDTKILNMGKAEELGIFTEGGEIDNLENAGIDDISDDDL